MARHGITLCLKLFLLVCGVAPAAFSSAPLSQSQLCCLLPNGVNILLLDAGSFQLVPAAFPAALFQRPRNIMF